MKISQYGAWFQVQDTWVDVGFHGPRSCLVSSRARPTCARHSDPSVQPIQTDPSRERWRSTSASAHESGSTWVGVRVRRKV